MEILKIKRDSVRRCFTPVYSSQTRRFYFKRLAKDDSNMQNQTGKQRKTFIQINQITLKVRFIKPTILTLHFH